MAEVAGEGLRSAIALISMNGGHSRAERVERHLHVVVME
jgi:hypothetical protein